MARHCFRDSLRPLQGSFYRGAILLYVYCPYIWAQVDWKTSLSLFVEVSPPPPRPLTPWWWCAFISYPLSFRRASLAGARISYNYPERPSIRSIWKIENFSKNSYAKNGSGSMVTAPPPVSKAEKFFPHNSPRIELTPQGADFPTELYRPRLNYRSSDDRISPLRSFHDRKLNLNYCYHFFFCFPSLFFFLLTWKKYVGLKLFRELGVSTVASGYERGYEVWLGQIRIGFLSILITIGIASNWSYLLFKFKYDWKQSNTSYGFVRLG